MYIAIDIGGTNIRIGLLDVKKPSLIKQTSFLTPPDFDDGIKSIVAEIKKLIEDQKIEGIGLCAPGNINKEEGYIISSEFLRSWQQKPLTKTLREIFGCNVLIDNDAVLAAQGEVFYGHGKNFEKFVYLTWGSGFGGSFVSRVNGKVLIIPLEPGHQIVEWEGESCSCGQRGCVEAYIGGKYLQKRYGKKPEDIKEDNIWNAIAEKATQGIVNILMLQPVEHIILGGGLILKQSHLIERIKLNLSKQLSFLKVPAINLAQYGEDAGLYGALALLHRD